MTKKLILIALMVVFSVSMAEQAHAWLNTEDVDGRTVALQAKDAPYVPDDKYNNSLAVLNVPVVSPSPNYHPQNSATASTATSDRSLSTYAPAAGQ